MSFVIKPFKSDDINLTSFLVDLELRIAEAFRVGEFESLNVSEINVEPDKPRDGDIINADGTNYDPGTGKGIYYYNGSTYVKLG